MKKVICWLRENSLCLLGIHYDLNIDNEGLTGEHRCRFCKRLGWNAIQWPKA